MTKSTAIKVDEDLSEDVVECLRAAGFVADSVRGQGWTGRPDEVVWPAVQVEERTFITADKGIAARAQATRRHHGLVILRPDRESRQSYVRLVQLLIDRNILVDVVDTIVVASEGRVRVRKS